MKLKQQIDEFKEIYHEFDKLNLKMALLYQRGIVDNKGKSLKMLSWTCR